MTSPIRRTKHSRPSQFDADHKSRPFPEKIYFPDLPLRSKLLVLGRSSSTMEEMRALTPDEIQTALGRLETGLERYLWLQHRVRACDVNTNEEFQRCFCRFYRVRRGSQWRSVYFGLLESSKLKGIDFPEALKEINSRTGRIEASFASKLVATLDPSKPVIDRYVLEYFELRLPSWGSRDRETKTIDMYYDLRDKYSVFIQSPTGKMIQELFDSRYPKSEVSELKRVDLVLWQIRPKNQNRR